MLDLSREHTFAGEKSANTFPGETSKCHTFGGGILDFQEETFTGQIYLNATSGLVFWSHFENSFHVPSQEYLPNGTSGHKNI